MAEDKGDLVAQTAGGEVRVSRDAAMPDVEPGHKGEELNPGGVFDPNAARRAAEGRGPGLQDSEIVQPAHWQQVAPFEETDAGRASYLAALEREEQMAKQATAEDKGTVASVGAELARVRKAERDAAKEQPAST